MSDLKEFAGKGGQVLESATGFRFFASWLAPGSLGPKRLHGISLRQSTLLVENSNDRFNRETLGSRLTLPIAHGEGNYRADDAVLSELEANDQVLLRYEGNPNARQRYRRYSKSEGNVYGMMPHPERRLKRTIRCRMACLSSRPLSNPSKRPRRSNFHHHDAPSSIQSSSEPRTLPEREITPELVAQHGLLPRSMKTCCRFSAGNPTSRNWGFSR